MSVTKVLACDAPGCTERIGVVEGEVFLAHGWLYRRISDVLQTSVGDEAEYHYCPLHSPHVPLLHPRVRNAIDVIAAENAVKVSK